MNKEITYTFSERFVDDKSKLTQDIRDKVDKSIILFLNNPDHPSLDNQPLEGVKKNQNIWKFRSDQAYRIFYTRLDGNRIFFLTITNHDYSKKAKTKFQVNPIYGNFQEYSDEGEIEELLKSEPQTQESEMLFSHVSESDLRKLGVPQDLIKLTKLIPGRADLKKYAEAFPVDVYQALDLVASGCSVDDVIQVIYGNTQSVKKADTADLDAAFANPVTQSRFVQIKNEDDYQQMLAGPLEKWRIFLHPDQRRAVVKNYNGPARILGGAGTGKTVTAMHRAKWLAEKMAAGKKVFFTTFTKNLAEDIQSNLHKLCTDEIFGRIEVKNLDIWAASYYQQRSKGIEVIYDVTDLWKAAYKKNTDVLLPVEFFQEEWEQVLVPNEVFTCAEYMKVQRKGRGDSLKGGWKKRQEVWQVIQAFMDLCEQKKVIDSRRAMIEVRKMIEQEEKAPLYESIIVDEGQDFGEEAYRLLRAMAGPEHRNDLFIAGDAHQRIYQRRQSLSKCGINVRGRSTILRVNYRTTEQIREAAMQVLQGMDFDDLDDGIENGNGYRSLIEGQIPQIKSFHTIEDEVDFLVSCIHNYQSAGEELKDICLTARTKNLLKEYADLFEERGIPIYMMTDSIDDRSVDGLRLATMFRVKGLEFNHMLIAGASDDKIPARFLLRPDMSEIQREEFFKTERCLLYVAMTRAKLTVVISSIGTMSSFLEAPAA